MGCVCRKETSIHQNNSSQKASKTKHTISVLVAPFRFTREDAEILLKSAQIGAYILSHDFTEERFVSVSSGNFVCHHAISVRDSICMVGGETFDTIQEALNHFQYNPLGTVYLTHHYSNNVNVSKKCSSLKNTEKQGKKRRTVSFRNVTSPILQQADQVVIPEEPICKPIESSVSSASEKELQVLSDGESIPIIPAPSGTRPPPLYPRFSQLAMEHQENDENDLKDSRKMLFELYKGNPKLKYTQKMNEVKILLLGITDLLNERETILNTIHKKIEHLSKDEKISFEVIDLAFDDKNDNTKEEEYIERLSMCVTECGELNIPCILIIFLNQNSDWSLPPRYIPSEQFELTSQTFNEEDTEKLFNSYSLDENRTGHSYVLNDGVNSSLTSDIMEIIKYSNLSKCSRKVLRWQIDEFTKCKSLSRILLVERVISQLKECKNEEVAEYLSTIKPKDINIEGLLQDDVKFTKEEGYVKMEVSMEQLSTEASKVEYFCSVSNKVMDYVKLNLRTITTSMKQSTINDMEYDEVMYHIIKARSIYCKSAIDDVNFEKVKTYIQGDTSTPLVIFGTRNNEKLSLMSHVSFYAFDWFNSVCCIITRFIGMTPDSYSNILLLRSICTQICYCYSIEPNFNFKDTEQLKQYFEDLLLLPTDSLPMVLTLDSPCSDDFLSFLPSHLSKYVKIVVSLDSKDFSEDQHFQCMRMDHLDESSSTNALQQIDRHLVKNERTLTYSQQDMVSQIVCNHYADTFVRFLKEELVIWKSTDCKAIEVKNTEECYAHLMSKVNAIFGNSCTTGIIFCISHGVFGVPKKVLIVFLSMLLNINKPSRVVDMVDKVIKIWSSICYYEVIYGLPFIRWYDNNEAQKLSPFINDELESLYHTYLRKSFVETIKRCFNSKDVAILQHIHLRFELKYGALNELYDLLNFRYFFSRLRCLSLSHVINDIELVIREYPTNVAFRILKEIFVLSDKNVVNDKENFPLQVLCRLYDVYTVNVSTIKTIKEHDVFSRVKDTLQRAYLKTFVNAAFNHCKRFIPNVRCLLSPLSLTDVSYEKQSILNIKDLKVIFIENNNSIEFITYSCQLGVINMYPIDKGDKYKTIEIDGLLGIKAVGYGQLFVTTKTSNFISERSEMCNLDETDFFDIICCTSDVFVSLNASKTSLSLHDQLDDRLIWSYKSHEVIYDVIVSANNSRVVCFLESDMGKTYSVNHQQSSYFREPIVVVNISKQEYVTFSCIESFCKLSCISDQGNYLIRVTAVTMKILVWELNSCELLHKTESHSCRLLDVVAKENSSNITVLAADGTLLIYDLESGELKHKLYKKSTFKRSNYLKNSYKLSVTADEKYGAVSESRDDFPDSVVIWDLVTGESLVEFTSDFHSTGFFMSPLGDFALSICPKGLCRFIL